MPHHVHPLVEARGPSSFFASRQSIRLSRVDYTDMNTMYIDHTYAIHVSSLACCLDFLLSVHP